MGILNIHLLIVIVLALDLTWIFVMKSMYNALVHRIQGKDIVIRVIPAIISYTCVISGIALFANPLIRQQLETSANKSLINISKLCMLYGGGLGLIVYGVFNFTNLAMFQDYNVMIGLIDTLWGVILCTVATFIYFTALIR